MTTSCECGKIPRQGEAFDRTRHCVECTRRDRFTRIRPSGPQERKKEVARRPLPCIFLGRLISRARCNCPRKDTRFCDVGLGNVTQANQCETCQHYIADDPNEHPP